MASSVTGDNAGTTAGPSRIPFDPDSPLFVAQATVASAVLGATTGASMGVIKSVNPFALSLGMGINCGLAGLTFFGMREYLVTPALIVYRSDTQGMSEKARGKLPERPSLADVRYDRVLDSGVAGVLAGGTLSGFLRGKGTIPRAGLTAGAVTALLQLTVNQFRIVRLQLLARRNQATNDTEATLASALPEVSSSNRPESTFDVGLRASLENPGILPPTPAEESQTLPGKLIRGLSTFLPVRKLSDEDYLALLVKKRNEVDKRLKEIEDEEWRIFQSAQVGQSQRR